MIKYCKENGTNRPIRIPVVGDRWYDNLGKCHYFNGREWIEPVILTQIAVTKVHIWVNHDGYDHIHMHTTLPPPAEEAQSGAILTMLVPAHTGYEYCKQHLSSTVSIELMSSPICGVKNIY